MFQALLHGARMSITRLDYCRFLLSSQVNYTLTSFADHAQKGSHDTIGRYGETITPRLVWDNLKQQVQPHAKAYLLFDDTVPDKNHSRKIEPARRQWSGHAKRVIQGIGWSDFVSCSTFITQ